MTNKQTKPRQFQHNHHVKQWRGYNSDRKRIASIKAGIVFRRRLLDKELSALEQAERTIHNLILNHGSSADIMFLVNS